ncbi:MAG: hypothetical protein J6Q70_00435 [Clostridia bacterium]|nr:hypothetical protein [Clostridia bacterium]
MKKQKIFLKLAKSVCKAVERSKRLSQFLKWKSLFCFWGYLFFLLQVSVLVVAFLAGRALFFAPRVAVFAPFPSFLPLFWSAFCADVGFLPSLPEGRGACVFAGRTKQSGVGPMTITMLLKNTLTAARNKAGK